MNEWRMYEKNISMHFSNFLHDVYQTTKGSDFFKAKLEEFH